MKFSYTYQTAQNEKRTGVISASTRDEAFCQLRAQGIRPVKVVSLSGTKANGEERVITRKRFVFVALALGVLAGAACAVWLSNADFRDALVIETERTAQGLLTQHTKLVATLHLEALRDYRSILANERDVAAWQRIVLGRSELESLKASVKHLYRGAQDKVGGGSADKTLRLLDESYARVMDEIELSEARLANDERAFRLLEENRGKWRIENGSVVWNDPELGNRFMSCSRELH